MTQHINHLDLDLDYYLPKSPVWVGLGIGGQLAASTKRVIIWQGVKIHTTPDVVFGKNTITNAITTTNTTTTC